MLDVPSSTNKTLLFFSANQKDALTKLAELHEAYLKTHPERLSNAAYTLARRREHLKLRGFVIADGTSPFRLTSHHKPQENPSKVAFIFTGQRAQWAQMGAKLAHQYPVFRRSIEDMDRTLRSLEHAPAWSLQDLLLNCTDSRVMRKAEYSQPLCTALQIALVDLLRS